jgi:hypothetical protein
MHTHAPSVRPPCALCTPYARPMRALCAPCVRPPSPSRSNSRFMPKGTVYLVSGELSYSPPPKPPPHAHFVSLSIRPSVCLLSLDPSMHSFPFTASFFVFFFLLQSLACSPCIFFIRNFCPSYNIPFCLLFILSS